MLVLCDRQKSRVFAKVGQRHQRYLARNEAESQHLQTGLPRTRVREVRYLSQHTNMSKDTKNSSADLSRYRWVELFDFVLSERDGFETDTLVYLQIMFGMFNGAIVDEKALPVNDLDSYLAAVKVLKKSLKHIQKAFPDNSRYSNILSGVLDILERTDYHSYEPIFKIMKLVTTLTSKFPCLEKTGIQINRKRAVLHSKKMTTRPNWSATAGPIARFNA